MNHTTLYIYMGLYLVSFIAIIWQGNALKKRKPKYTDRDIYFTAIVGSFIWFGIFCLFEIAFSWVKIMAIRLYTKIKYKL